MSYNNKKIDSKKIYSLLDLPPVKECGGTLDKDGIDSYWGESLTLQADAENADITLIMQKYAKTGIFNATIREGLQYGDISQLPDYHAAYNEIARANELFEALDAKIRSRFQNDPSKMIDFIADDSNYDEAVKLGLVQAKKQLDNINAAQSSAKGSEEPKKASEEAKKS